jgi:hypothetical protein
METQMGSENGKIHRLETVRSEVPGSAQSAAYDQTSGAMEAHRDMSKVAMIVSLLAVLLLVIFFFGMNRNIAGLTDEVKSLGTLREDVSSLDQRMVQLQADIPVRMKRMIAHDMVNEMAMKATYLADILDSEAQKAAMRSVLKELQAVRADLEQ